MQLSQKERMLIEDERHHEELCVQKYTQASTQSSCPQLKQLFNKLATEEQKHYDTLTQILNGQQPNLGQGNQNQQSNNMQQNLSTQIMQNNTNNNANQNYNQQDALLCNDLLNTEKFISSTYNTAIFECVDPTIRKALQHIQQDEQSHGEQLFNYLNSHGMYNVKY